MTYQSQAFAYALGWAGFVAWVAYAMGSRIGFGQARALREALLWGGCLMAGTGMDYVLTALSSRNGLN